MTSSNPGAGAEGASRTGNRRCIMDACRQGRDACPCPSICEDDSLPLTRTGVLLLFLGAVVSWGILILIFGNIVLFLLSLTHF